MKMTMAVVATIVFAVFLSLANGPRFLSAAIESQGPIDSERVAINRNTVERCISQDPSFCLDSFVMSMNGDILKISRCSKSCPPYEMDIGTLMEYPPDEQFLNGIKTIVLQVDHQQWSIVAKRYKKQLREFLQSRT